MSKEDVENSMLEELRKIREALGPKPAAPAPPAPKGFMKEFSAFIEKYGIIGLALAFIIGGAVAKLVSALVGDIIMPVVTFFIPGGAWQQAVLALGPIHLAVGHFASAIIDFLIIAVLIFYSMKRLNKT